MNLFSTDGIDAFIYAWEQLAKSEKFAGSVLSLFSDTVNVARQYPQLAFKTNDGEMIFVTYSSCSINSREDTWVITMSNKNPVVTLSNILKELYPLFEDIHINETNSSILSLTCTKPYNGRTNAVCVRSAIFNAMRDFSTFVPSLTPKDFCRFTVNELRETMNLKPVEDIGVDILGNRIHVNIVFVDIDDEEQKEALDSLNAIARGYLAFKDLKNTIIDFQANTINTDDSASPLQYPDILQADIVICRKCSSMKDNWAAVYAKKNAIPRYALEALLNKEDNLFTPFNTIFAKKTPANMEKSE